MRPFGRVDGSRIASPPDMPSLPRALQSQELRV